jgi:hypothetical protein
MGMCEADPCKKPCGFGRVCDDDSGMCVQDPCPFVMCPQGQECDPNRGGMCVDSPCAGTMCPNPGEVCKLGTCYDPADFQPDAGVAEYVTTGGGGGCAAGGGAGGAGLGAALALLLVRRRRPARGQEVRS